MGHVFVSYKKEDRARVTPLVDALRRGGVDIWWDQDIPAGAPWRRTIVEHLDTAELVLVAWSKQSTAEGGRYVLEEAERAAARRAYLGVLIDPVMPPFGFTEMQACDLSDWSGRPDDPQLEGFVAQVKAWLKGEHHITPARAPAAVRPKGRLGLAIGIGAAALVGVIAALFLWLRPPSEPAREALTPTAFVNARLGELSCTWASIAGIDPGAGGERVRLRGISGAPGAIQPALLRQAREQGVPLADVDAREVLEAPQSVCAALQTIQPYRSRDRERLEVTPQIGPLRRDAEGWVGDLQYQVDFGGLPQHAAVLGLDSLNGIQRMVPDLQEHRRNVTPVMASGEKLTYQSGFTFDRPDERNVGLILMTSTRPIDFDLVESIGRSTDPAVMRRIEEAATAGQWRFELGIVRCGVEARGDRRC